MSVPLLPPMSSPEDNKDLPTTLAQDLGHSMEDGVTRAQGWLESSHWFQSPLVITQSLESNGVVLGATGVFLASGVLNKDEKGYVRCGVKSLSIDRGFRGDAHHDGSIRHI